MTNSSSNTSITTTLKSNQAQGYSYPSSKGPGIKLDSFFKMISSLKQDFSHPFLSNLINPLLENELLKQKKWEIEELNQLRKELSDIQNECFIYLSTHYSYQPTENMIGIRILLDWINELYCNNATKQFEQALQKQKNILLDKSLSKFDRLNALTTLAYIYRIYPSKEQQSIPIYLEIIELAQRFLEKAFDKRLYDFINTSLHFLTQLFVDNKDNFNYENLNALYYLMPLLKKNETSIPIFDRTNKYNNDLNKLIDLTQSALSVSIDINQSEEKNTRQFKKLASLSTTDSRIFSNVLKVGDGVWHTPKEDESPAPSTPSPKRK